MAAQEKKIMFLSITLRSAFVIKCNKSPFHYNILGGGKQATLPSPPPSAQNVTAAQVTLLSSHLKRLLSRSATYRRNAYIEFFLAMWTFILMNSQVCPASSWKKKYLVLTEIDDAVLNEPPALLH